MIRVHTEHPYDVHLGPGVLTELPGAIDGASSVAIVYPEALPHLADRVEALISQSTLRIPVPDAEAAKTPAVVDACWRLLAGAGFTRNAAVVGIGGGSTTDLAGFVAATWLRGVDLVTVPTTVLAMVDAAVGGKTGINLPAGKNLVGAFHEPRAVLCDFTLLDSLPEAEVRAGLAEVVKCGFIADTAILDLVARPDVLDTTSPTFAEAVRRAVQVKAGVVARDLRERTSTGDRVGRETLNYGHTLGHAIEAWSGYTWRHGEAIAVGMAWVARVSQQLLGLDAAVVDRTDALLTGLGLPVHVDAPYDELRPWMALDKKARGATLRLVGLRAEGRPSIIEGPDEACLEACYDDIAR
ncbi:3-dehydroquinate synthase [uncultured Tessaracoccus sp.]|uniref:3-dehydroquinate synthase n=1 Tax=uncultured Tessaracoccus sp. TaxID=905023 RepID=UPI0025F0235C|nr:3-dehydroquinate synthase [uncultured Tessaracoccus sp.]